MRNGPVQGVEVGRQVIRLLPEEGADIEVDPGDERVYPHPEP